MSAKLAKRTAATGPVKYQVHGSIERPTALSIEINYEEAPIPQHYYVADWFEITTRDLEVVLSFGNLDRPGQLRSKIEIVFPVPLFISQLWKSSRDFHQLLKKFIDSVGLQPLVREQAELRTDKLQVLRSNNALMVMSGTECLLDFFYISPKEMWAKPRQRRELELEPIVRVMVSPTFLLGFLDACEPIVSELKEKFTDLLRKGEPYADLESHENG